MRLVVDANILVAELVRERGRALVANPALQLYMAEQAWEEARYELGKRVAAMTGQGKLGEGAGEALLEAAFALAELRVTLVPEEVYANLEDEARSRIPRDPDDWPSVALALALDASIWTHDGDFLGCGLPTWTTDTLMAHLQG